MIVEKVIGNRKTFDIGNRQVEHVWLEWYELEKKLLRKSPKAEKRLEFGQENRLRMEIFCLQMKTVLLQWRFFPVN